MKAKYLVAIVVLFCAIVTMATMAIIMKSETTRLQKELAEKEAQIQVYKQAAEKAEKRSERVSNLVKTIKEIQSGNKSYSSQIPLLTNTEIHVVADLAVDFEDRNKWGASAEWILAIIQQESLYHKYAISSHKCVGLMQLYPETAERVASSRSFEYNNLRDVRTNVQIGIWYFEDILDMTNGNVLLSLHKYNWGENTVVALGTNDYPYRVKDYYSKYSERKENGKKGVDKLEQPSVDRMGRLPT
ncbi:MAG: lytic transglycosylase domain-containing protein [Halobacteriota archaeon]|nr:lytic transglycosylase domain-containing protein [Halobacteriota archaeon]